MTDVEMKDASKPAAEEAKKDDQKQEEPADCFYGKLMTQLDADILTFVVYHCCRFEEVAGSSGKGWQRKRL